jgi:hypothetical protein
VQVFSCLRYVQDQPQVFVAVVNPGSIPLGRAVGMEREFVNRYSQVFSGLWSTIPKQKP